MPQYSVQVKTDLLLIIQKKAANSNFLTFHGLELWSLFSIDETRSVKDCHVSAILSKKVKKLPFYKDDQKKSKSGSTC